MVCVEPVVKMSTLMQSQAVHRNRSGQVSNAGLIMIGKFPSVSQCVPWIFSQSSDLHMLRLDAGIVSLYIVYQGKYGDTGQQLDRV